MHVQYQTSKALHRKIKTQVACDRPVSDFAWEIHMMLVACARSLPQLHRKVIASSSHALGQYQSSHGKLRTSD
eukprot:1812972-Rhodomonas_salina.1